MSDIEVAIRKKVEEKLALLLSPQTLNTVGATFAEQIKKRTRLGYGVPDPGVAQEKLKPLSDDYKKWRKENKSKLSDATTPAKSNLTQTGEMLDSITYRVEGRSVILFFSNAFAKYKAWANTERGRPFFTLSKAERKQLRDLLMKILRDIP